MKNKTEECGDCSGYGYIFGSQAFNEKQCKECKGTGFKLGFLPLQNIMITCILQDWLLGGRDLPESEQGRRQKIINKLENYYEVLINETN